MKKKVIIPTVGILSVMLVFFISYKYSKNKIENKSTKEVENSVYKKEKEVLKDDLIIKLVSTGTENEVESLKEIKSERKIQGNLTEEELLEILSKEGYKQTVKADNMMIFRKEILNNFENNKYYIGENKEYFTIFKGNKDGKLDIYKEYDMALDLIRLSEGEKKAIKNKTFYSSFNLKEVEEKMDAFTS